MPWIGEDIYLWTKSKHKFTLPRRDELCPKGVHPGIVGGVLLKVEDFAAVLHIFFILV